jgi:hypothetical protein
MPAKQPSLKAQQAKAARVARAGLESAARMRQLEDAQAAVAALESALKSVREEKEVCSTLDNHLIGFYDEIDKLAKGKSLMAATDLIVEHANSIVRDAKALIKQDVYVDRIKEFVSAGDNPVYPDVLVTLRAVKQAVDRCNPRLEESIKRIIWKLSEARTIATALRHYMDSEGEIPTKAQIEIGVRNPASTWFDGAYSHSSFKLSRLDSLSIREHLTAGLTTVEDGE